MCGARVASEGRAMNLGIDLITGVFDWEIRGRESTVTIRLLGCDEIVV